MQISVARSTEYNMLFVGATQLQSTSGAAQSSATIGIGALVGTAIGSLLLGVVITAFILLGIPRSVVITNRLAIPHIVVP